MLTPANRRIQNSNAWFPYDRCGRHDRCSRCDRGRKRAIAAMTCFPLIAAIAAKTGLKPGVKLNLGAKFNPHWRKSTEDSCWSLVIFSFSLSFAHIKILSDFGPVIQFHKPVSVVLAKLDVQTTIFLLFFHKQHALRHFALHNKVLWDIK